MIESDSAPRRSRPEGVPMLVAESLVLLFLEDHPAASEPLIHETLGLPKGTVARALRRLCAARVLSRSRERCPTANDATRERLMWVYRIRPTSGTPNAPRGMSMA
jgi:predicted transcriptional regulator